MKTKLFLIVILISKFTFGQIVDIPDTNFKNALTQGSIDANNDGEIQVSEAEAITSLYLQNLIISDLTGIQSFTNLTSLDIRNNSLTNLDVSGLTSLASLFCSDNQLTNLNVSGCIGLYNLYCDTNNLTSLDISSLSNLLELDCKYNQLTSINMTNITLLREFNCIWNELTSLDVSNLTNLIELHCSGNQITSLDVSNSTDLSVLYCHSNQLLDLNIKNDKVMPSLHFYNNPNIEYVCADEIKLETVQNKLDAYNYNETCNVNTYCSFTPAGTVYTIQGISSFDNEVNGCDTDDVSVPNIRFNITDGTNSGSYIADNSGNYNLAVQSGTHTFTPQLENPSYFAISPANFNVSFPSESSPYIQNFCLTPNNVYNDLEIVLIPTSAARPGFDANYKIVYRNKGNTQLSGSVELNFDDSVLDFLTASINTTAQSTGNLSWDYDNLVPFETREIALVFNINSPTETPSVNINDSLIFDAVINPITNDELPEDNTLTLNQIVVGSFDPNDKICLEGASIAPEMIGDYLHYLIRFENTGSHPATNIVVKDIIDTSKFDITTLRITDKSHSCVTRVKNPNNVEFIFENINLPFDDANNDGYIAFKIKTLSTLSVGNQITNKADIFFDYNFPITTNEYLTSIQTLGINEQSISKIAMYPNPVKDVLQFNTNEQIVKIEIYDMVGRIVSSHIILENQLEVINLKTGNYLLKLYTKKGFSIKRLIKE